MQLSDINDAAVKEYLAGKIDEAELAARLPENAPVEVVDGAVRIIPPEEHRRRIRERRAERARAAKQNGKHKPCGEDIKTAWPRTRQEIQASANPTMQQLLDAHDRCIESRTDWSECKKNARRRRLIKQWKEARSLAKPILFIVNGGLGDAAELTRTLIVAARIGYDVYVCAWGGNTRLMVPFWERTAGITPLSRERAEEIEWEAILCRTRMEALQERAAKMTSRRLINAGGGPNLRTGDRELLVELGHDRELIDALYDEAPLAAMLPKHEAKRDKIVIAPGVGRAAVAFAEKKQGRWDKRFRGWPEVIRRLPPQIVLIGDETAREPWMSELPDDIDDRIGKTDDITELLPLFAGTRILFAPDNGIAHLAGLFGVPTVSLFTVTDPAKFAPPHARVILDPEPWQVIDALHLHDRPECIPDAAPASNRLLSVIMTAHNEGAEVRATCEDVRRHAGCPVEIIVVDEASTDGSCSDLPDWVRVIRNEERTGVAPARNQAFAAATGDAIMVLDAHMRVRAGTPAAMMEAAIERSAVIVPGMIPLYNAKKKPIHVCRWTVSRGRLASSWRKTLTDDEFAPTPSWVAPGWVISRDCWERVGPWPASLSGWGSTEVCKSLQVHFAGIDTLAMRDAVVWHRFRGRFPYSVSNSGVWRNAYAVARIMFGRETFERCFLPWMRRQYDNDSIRQLLDSDTLAADAAEAAKRRVRDPVEFLRTHLPELAPTEEPTHAPTHEPTAAQTAATPPIADPAHAVVCNHIIALKRSGHHAVIHWMMQHFTEAAIPVHFENNRGIRYLVETARTAEAWRLTAPDPPAAVFVNYEDCFPLTDRMIRRRPGASPAVLHAIARRTDQPPFAAFRHVVWIVLRDPRNMFASRLQRDMQADCRVAAAWTEQARTALGAIDSPLPVHTIIFDRWATDEQYRRNLSARLGLPFTDEARDHLATEGDGSSFDQMKYRNRASEMQVTDRHSHTDQDRLAAILNKHPELMQTWKTLNQKAP